MKHAGSIRKAKGIERLCYTNITGNDATYFEIGESGKKCEGGGGELLSRDTYLDKETVVDKRKDRHRGIETRTQQHSKIHRERERERDT